MNIKSSVGRSLARLASTSSIRARALAAAGAVIGLSAYTGIVATPVVEAANVPCDAASLVNALAPISAAGHSGTLSLAAGCTYTMTAVNNTFDGPNAFPDILGSVTIIGNGATITRSGATEFRFFVVDDGGSMNISNVTLSNGSIPTGELHGGGAILNRDHLTATGITVSGNHSMGSTGGGGIDNHDKGVLSVTNSTFSGNVGLQGGGIEDEATLCHTSTPVCGSATVTNTTFTGNSTTMFGGGGFEGQLDSNSAPVCPPPASLGVVECQEPGGAHDTLTGDTFTGNSSVTEGGGIAIFGTATVTNSTITGNSTGSGGGGGIQNTGTLTVVASTISGNSTTSPTGSDLHSFTDVTHQPGTTGVSMSIMGSGTGANCGGTNPMTNNGYNIDSGTSCGFSNANHSQSSTDPLLNSLASNGGPTQTMSLQNGSPAIGAGPGPCAVSTDQRGALRSNPCDIGAFEIYTTPPTTPTGLTATAQAHAAEIDLTWTASNSLLGITGYDILREGSKVATVTGTSYADKGLADATTYHYTVDAFDGNLTSAQSSAASATTPDLTPPSVPTGLSAHAVSGHEIDLSWTASTDNVAVAGYTVYRGGSALTTVAGTSYADMTVSDATTYSYAVDAYDAAGNHSAQSGPASATTPDVTPPSVPTGLSATTKNTPEVDLSWTASTDNVAVTGYDVFRNASKIATIGATANYVDTGVAFQGTYTYTVDAFDAAGNHSAQSAGLIVTVAPFAGLYTLDGYGGIAADDSPAVSQSAYWAGWQIARAAHVQPGAGQNGFLLDGYGGLHQFGSSAPVESSGSSLGHYWGFDIARDFGFMPDGTGGYVLDGYGGLHPFGVNGHAAPAPAQGTPYWGWDVAKKVVIFPDGSGGYVLDAYGGIHPFGIGGPTPSTVAMVAGTGYWSWRAAVDIVLIAGNGGHSGYVLDAFGGLHPFHPLGDGSTMPGGIATSYFGFNIARGVFFLPGSATAGYTLDGYGGIHPFGGAPAVHHYPYFGWDIARGLLGD